MDLDTTLPVIGMTCGGCVASVKRVLEALPGVRHADVSLDAARAQVVHDPAQAPVAVLRAAIEAAGFEVPAS
jgi:copper chaperone